jgi:hypothetical protein
VPTSTVRQRVDAFPTQLVLTIAWIVIGVPVCIRLRNSILWVALMSVYAICIAHWTAYLAWRAKREAAHTSEDL